MSTTQPLASSWGLEGEYSTRRFAESPAECSDQFDGFQRCLSGIAAGDAEALASFYDQTRSLVYGLALRMLGNRADAEEIALDVYTQVWRSARNFDARRGTALAWLLMLTRSRAIDRLRSASNRHRKEEAFDEHRLIPDPGASIEEVCVMEDQRRRVRAAIGRLTAAERQAIELTFLEGLTHTELAARLNQPLGTVKSRVRVALMKLREELRRAG